MKKLIEKNNSFEEVVENLKREHSDQLDTQLRQYSIDLQHQLENQKEILNEDDENKLQRQLVDQTKALNEGHENKLRDLQRKHAEELKR